MHRYMTENPTWGFHGTMKSAGADAAEAFDLAAQEIATIAKVDGFDAASWLDTRDGRHLADTVISRMITLDLPRAIHAAIGEWMSWNISEQSAESAGLPEPAIGLPYLVGLVVNHAIENESRAA